MKAAERLRTSAWKKLIKQKIKGNIQKRLWDEIGQKTKSKTIKDGEWERKKIHRTVQRRYSQGHHQNQVTHMGLEKEL